MTRKRDGVDLRALRNIGIIAHIDAGKTTTTERILYYTGKNHKIGEVHEGASTMDWMEQEQERGITITAAATTCFWEKDGRECQINIIDTPGHVDFTLEVERSLRVLDGAVVVLCGVGGVQPQTETVWRQSDKYQIPRMAFVNKLDRKGASYERVLCQLEDRFLVNAAPVTVPWYEGEDLLGVFHLIEEKAFVFSEDDYGSRVEAVDIPDKFVSECKESRRKLLEKLSNYDDVLLGQLLDEVDVSRVDIEAILRRECIAGNVVPVYAGSAFKNKGVQQLLDGVVQFLPNPKESPLIEAWHVKKRENVPVNIDPSGEFSALIFKVQANIFANPICYLKLYSGKLNPGSVVNNISQGKKERIAKIYRIHSNKREELECAEAGEIVAVVGPAKSTTGDTLATKTNPVLLEPIAIPEPVISVAIEPKSKSEEERLSLSLSKLCLEDPSLKIISDRETGQTLISGMGELHLEVAVDRLKREYGQEVNVGKPQVSYRETVKASCREKEVFNRPVQGRSISVAVTIAVSPLDSEEEVENKIIFQPLVLLEQKSRDAIFSGLKDGLLSGVLSGYPLVKTKVEVCAVQILEGEPGAEVFSAAASMALRKCLRKAGSELLEPVMEVEVVGPSNFSGDIINNLNSIEGRILSINDERGQVTISAEVKLSSMFGYLTILRSITQGKASYTMVFARYA